MIHRRQSGLFTGTIYVGTFVTLMFVGLLTYQHIKSLTYEKVSIPITKYTFKISVTGVLFFFASLQLQLKFLSVSNRFLEIKCSSQEEGWKTHEFLILCSIGTGPFTPDFSRTGKAGSRCWLVALSQNYGGTNYCVWVETD